MNITNEYTTDVETKTGVSFISLNSRHQFLAILKTTFFRISGFKHHSSTTKKELNLETDFSYISFVSKTPSSRFAHQTLSPFHLFKVNTHVDIFSNNIPTRISFQTIYPCGYLFKQYTQVDIFSNNIPRWIY